MELNCRIAVMSGSVGCHKKGQYFLEAFFWENTFLERKIICEFKLNSLEMQGLYCNQK